MADQERITVTDARRAGFCASGIAQWLKAKGIPYRELKDEGIAPDDPRVAGDAHVDRILATRRKRAL